MKYDPSIIGKKVRITYPGRYFGKIVKVLDCSSWFPGAALTTEPQWWKFWDSHHWDWEHLEPVGEQMPAEYYTANSDNIEDRIPTSWGQP